MYEIRHADDGDPVQIAKGIAVNHFGTILTLEAIKLPDDGYLDFDNDALNFGCGDCRSVSEFLDKYVKGV